MSNITVLSDHTTETPVADQNDISDSLLLYVWLPQLHAMFTLLQKVL